MAFSELDLGREGSSGTVSEVTSINIVYGSPLDSKILKSVAGLNPFW